MIEIEDKATGAILFKSEETPNDRRLKELENKVKQLSKEITYMSNELNHIKSILLKSTN